MRHRAGHTRPTGVYEGYTPISPSEKGTHAHVGAVEGKAGREGRNREKDIELACLCEAAYAAILDESSSPPSPEEYASAYLDGTESAYFSRLLRERLWEAAFRGAVETILNPGGYLPESAETRLREAFGRWRASNYESEAELLEVERMAWEVTRKATKHKVSHPSHPSGR